MNKNTYRTVLFFAAAVFALLPLTYCATALAASAPTASAGPDLYVNSGQAITLQGSGSDPQGSSLAYYWNCSGGTLSNPSVAQPTFTAPYATNGNNQTTYTCAFAVTNTYGLSASDSMIVYVNSNSQQVGGITVQTNNATGVQNNQATLQGYLSLPYQSSTGTYVWFQWGTDTNYGSTSFQQSMGFAGSFSQQIGNLSPNTTYHFRAVAQNNGQTLYGQDMTFYSSGSNYYGNSTLSISKKVINLTSGNLNWQSSVNARPGDILSFAVTIQTGNLDAHNVVVRDVFPSNLIYRGNVMLNTSNYSGDINSGINIGTVYANQPVVVSYNAQVSANAYGSAILTNNVSVTSNDAGSQTASASVFVTNSYVLGATTISTGLTNDFFTGSFFLPLFLIIFMSWLYFSGRVYKFADWLKAKI